MPHPSSEPQGSSSPAADLTAEVAPTGRQASTASAAAPGARAARPRVPLTPGPMPGEDPTEPTAARLTRRLLGSATVDIDAAPRARLLGWLGPLAVTLLGGVVRFVDLGRPHQLVFDETYYVKDAYSMITRGFEAGWGDNPNPRFEAGDTSMLQYAAEYVVHPPLGKWIIGWGMQLGGGVTSSFAWRLSVAVLGTLAVLIIARIGRRLFASTALGTLAGLLMAVDGLAIVMSRVSLLDPVLMFFVLCAFGALLLDRDQARRRLAARTAAIVDAGGTLDVFGPALGIRWWRIAAAVLLGLACGTKWSGIYFILVFGLMSVAWDASARRTVGVRQWHVGAVVRDGIVAAVVMVGLGFVTYLATWTSWFMSPSSDSSGGWNRQWAVENPGQGVLWLPAPLRSLWAYHVEMWHFHNTLVTPHAYAAHPLGWIVQWRPTSFYYPTSVSGLTGDAAHAACGASTCSQAITSLGNPLIWWLGAASMVVALYWLVRYRDWRAGAVLSGIAAGWLPWFAYAHRTIFTFYSIVFLPWVVLTLVYAMSLVIGPKDSAVAAERRVAIIVVGGVVAVIVAVSAFFYPVWTAQIIPYHSWHLRMWLPSWV